MIDQELTRGIIRETVGNFGRVTQIGRGFVHGSDMCHWWAIRVLTESKASEAQVAYLAHKIALVVPTSSVMMYYAKSEFLVLVFGEHEGQPALMDVELRETHMPVVEMCKYLI